MTNDQALQRALAALQKALVDTDHFDHGGMTSFAISEILEAALRAEFGHASERRAYQRLVS